MPGRTRTFPLPYPCICEPASPPRHFSSDAQGRFELRTIRPGSYPGGGNPSHIHLTMEGPRVPRQWTKDITFAGDPYLRDQDVRRSAADGKFGSIRSVTVRDGVEHVEFNIKESREGRF